MSYREQSPMNTAALRNNSTRSRDSNTTISAISYSRLITHRAVTGFATKRKKDIVQNNLMPDFWEHLYLVEVERQWSTSPRPEECSRF